MVGVKIFRHVFQTPNLTINFNAILRLICVVTGRLVRADRVSTQVSRIVTRSVRHKLFNKITGVLLCLPNKGLIGLSVVIVVDNMNRVSVLPLVVVVTIVIGLDTLHVFAVLRVRDRLAPGVHIDHNSGASLPSPAGASNDPRVSKLARVQALEISFLPH